MQSALRTDSASRYDAELVDGYTWPTVDRVEADLVEYGERAAHAIGLTMMRPATWWCCAYHG